MMKPLFEMIAEARLDENHWRREVCRRLEEKLNADRVEIQEYMEHDTFRFIIHKEGRRYVLEVSRLAIENVPSDPFEFLANLLRGALRGRSQAIGRSKRKGKIDIKKRLGDS